MESRINEILEKIKMVYMTFFNGTEKSVSEAERFFREPLNQATTELLSLLYEEEDRKIRENKVGLREMGLSVVRRNEKREILTTMGTVRYQRTYYRNKQGNYLYPADRIAGLEPYQRLSNAVSQGLVEAARRVSYAQSAQNVTNGKVSTQSVMRKVRAACQLPAEQWEDKPCPPVLHIDADEAHVTLRTGKNTIVPLASVYEGIEKHGKRGICKNVFHIGAYGKKSEEFWEEVLTQIEKRYDLSRTKLYLHGDGANWIQTGLEYLPDCVFVLDPYHKNKALRQALHALGKKKAAEYRKALWEALKQGDKERFDSIAATVPGDKKALNYLSSHFDAIHIRFTDRQARGGGATEPHVSHILSARLSSRPMAWSEETLRCFVPILASGRFSLKREKESSDPSQPFQKTGKRKRKTKTAPFSLGLPDPERAVSLPARSGKVTPLFHALPPF